MIAKTKPMMITCVLPVALGSRPLTLPSVFAFSNAGFHFSIKIYEFQLSAHIGNNIRVSRQIFISYVRSKKTWEKS